MLPSAFRSFDDDPFFDGHRDRMNALFDMAGTSGMERLEGEGVRDGGRHRDIARRPDRGTNDFFGSMMKNMQSMMPEMGSMMDSQQIGRNNGDGTSYVQSSVYSYCNTGEGAPDIYEAHHSNRTGSGGAREEKKALRDSRRQVEKMAVGRHIGERGRIVERSRQRGGEMQQHQELLGMGADDVDSYEREWQEKTRDWNRQPRRAAVRDHEERHDRRRNDAPLAIEGRKEQRRANRYKQ